MSIFNVYNKLRDALKEEKKPALESGNRSQRAQVSSGEMKKTKRGKAN